MILTDWLEIECIPRILSMYVLLITYVLILKNAVKLKFSCEFFIKLIKTVHIIIWINTFLFHEFEFLILKTCDVYLNASLGKIAR